MIEIERALQIIDEVTIERRKKTMSVLGALGHSLSATITSPMTLPSFDNSAMDGYAICGKADSYKVIGEIAAGQVCSRQLIDGEAMRIFTGAKVPGGSHAVVMQEKIKRSGDKVFIEEFPKEGLNIRLEGEELNVGDLVLEKGHKMDPASIGLLLSLGIETVEVEEHPKVAILVTGDELVESGTALVKGQIYETNGAVLQSALSSFGIEEISLHRVPDNYEATVNAISKALDQADILLISGGISVGDYDFVFKALMENEVEELFYKINQKPGKPLFFGQRENSYVFALPGNPGSALHCYYLYVRALIQRFLKSNKTLVYNCFLADDQTVKGIRPTYFRVRKNGSEVIIERKQNSSMLSSFAYGDGMILLTPGLHKKGEEVAMILF